MLRRKTGWVTIGALVSIIQLLGKVLGQHKESFQPMLLMDGLAAHIAEPVLRAASDAGIWVIFVPAGMTHLLQPLDTDVFAAYKRRLRQIYAEHRVDSLTGGMTMEDVVLAINTTCRDIVEGKDWGSIFAKTGFALEQRQVRRSILDALDWPSVPPCPSTLPSLADFQTLFPRRTEIPFWSDLRPPSAAKSAAKHGGNQEGPCRAR